MCGIGAVSLERGQAWDAWPLIRAMAVDLEERGPDAVGLGWIDPIEGWPWYWKTAGRPSKRIDRTDMPGGVRTALIHTRWATKGDPADAVNNHPVVAPGVLLVHNGVLTNDDDLFAMLGAERIGEVDSEALAALVSYGPELWDCHPAELWVLPEGRAAAAWLTTEDDSVHLVRAEGSPLVVGLLDGALVAASTRRAIRAGAKAADRRIFDCIDVPEGTYLRVAEGRIAEQRTFRTVPTPPPVVRPAPQRTVVSQASRDVDHARRRGEILFGNRRRAS
jgi:glucosamine 6-phosphate synthetase-like amidotransferase/phosphosugar isomerase protein